MANMRKTSRRAVFVLPELEDVARLKRYASDRDMLNSRGKPNLAGAILEIVSAGLRRMYPTLTPEEYRWCAEQQELNEAARRLKRNEKKNAKKNSKKEVR